MGKAKLFLNSISNMFDVALEEMQVETGLAKQIKSCNSTHTIRFGVKLKKGIQAVSYTHLRAHET